MVALTRLPCHRNEVILAGREPHRGKEDRAQQEKRGGCNSEDSRQPRGSQGLAPQYLGLLTRTIHDICSDCLPGLAVQRSVDRPAPRIPATSVRIVMPFLVIIISPL